MKKYTSRELIKLAKKQGFVYKRNNGDHQIYFNPKTGKTVVIVHPRKDYPTGTLNKILKGLGLK